MDLNVKSQIGNIINSYMGKQLIMIIPSQSLETNVDAAQINRFTLVNKQISQGLPYSYTTGRDWHRYCIHGTIDSKAFTMNLICWQPDNLLDLQDIAAWYTQQYGFHHVLFISLKGETRVWQYEGHRIKGQTRHLGADHILFVPAFTHAVHGRTMQQYLAFLDVPYDKIYHAFDSGESILYYVLYVRQCKLKTVLDVMALLFENVNINPIIYVTQEGNLYELGPEMSIHRNYGVFSRPNYESIFTQSGKNGLQIQIDEDFQYNRPSMFMRMGGPTILSRLTN